MKCSVLSLLNLYQVLVSVLKFILFKPFFLFYRGPVFEGIELREASDLNIFQARFEELWRK